MVEQLVLPMTMKFLNGLNRVYKVTFVFSVHFIHFGFKLLFVVPDAFRVVKFFSLIMSKLIIKHHFRALCIQISNMIRLQCFLLLQVYLLYVDSAEFLGWPEHSKVLLKKLFIIYNWLPVKKERDCYCKFVDGFFKSGKG